MRLERFEEGKPHALFHPEKSEGASGEGDRGKRKKNAGCRREDFPRLFGEDN